MTGPVPVRREAVRRSALPGALCFVPLLVCIGTAEPSRSSDSEEEVALPGEAAEPERKWDWRYEFTYGITSREGYGRGHAFIPELVVRRNFSENRGLGGVIGAPWYSGLVHDGFRAEAGVRYEQQVSPSFRLSATGGLLASPEVVDPFAEARVTAADHISLGARVETVRDDVVPYATLGLNGAPAVVSTVAAVLVFGALLVIVISIGPS